MRRKGSRLFVAGGVCAWLLVSSSVGAQEEPATDLHVAGGKFEHSLSGHELPQYTVIESFYRRVIRVATVGATRPAPWVGFLRKVGFEQGSAHEAALLEAAWRAQDLFECQLWNPALEGIESEEYQLARIRERAQELARIHKQLLQALEGETQGDSARLRLEQYCETDVRQGARLMGTDGAELSAYLEALEEFDREMQNNGGEQNEKLR